MDNFSIKEMAEEIALPLPLPSIGPSVKGPVMLCAIELYRLRSVDAHKQTARLPLKRALIVIIPKYLFEINGLGINLFSLTI